MITALVSGGFDPLHIGHVRMIQEAGRMSDWLVVVLNNDNWLKAKKGYCFMDELDRFEILESLRDVDEVILSDHAENPQDMSICSILRDVKPSFFVNGGDRYSENIPEYQVCEELGIHMVFNAGGGKIRSSSDLVKNYAH